MRMKALITGFVAAVSLLGALSAPATTYYWDNNGTNTGFGTAGGTWDNSTGDANWNTNSTGGAGTFVNNPTIADTLNFGNGATGLGTGTVAVGSATASSLMFASGSGIITLSGGTISLADAAVITANNTAKTNVISSVLAGATSTNFTKSGGGGVMLSGANTCTGALVCSGGLLVLANTNAFAGGITLGPAGGAGGTLKLTGGDELLPLTNTLTVGTYASTLELAGVRQTFQALVGLNQNYTVTGAGGTLVLVGSQYLWNNAPGAGTVVTLDMSKLSNFHYTNSTGLVRLYIARGGTTLNFYFASNAFLTAASVELGPSSFATNYFMLGTNASIQTTNCLVGDRTYVASVGYGSAHQNPRLSLRGLQGDSSRVTTMTVGSHSDGNSGPNNPVRGTLDMTSTAVGSILDARIGTLNVAIGQNSAKTNLTTGTILMGDGTLDATTIAIAKGVNLASALGTISVDGGMVQAGTLIFADRPTSPCTNNATFVLGGLSAATLRAGSITNGVDTGTGIAERSLIWRNGTIGNYDADTNLAIAAGLTLTVTNAAGTHAFAIDAGRTGTVNAAIVEAEAGCGLVKTGAGLLVLGGSNSVSVSATTVSNGTLLVNGSVTSAVTVASGGTLGGTGTVYGAVTNLGSAEATINGSSGVASLFTVSGALVLQPTSQLVLSSGSDLSTSVSNSYDIIRFTPGQRAGQFGSKNLPSGWTVKYDDAAGYVKVARGSEAGMMLMVQ